MSDIFRDCVYNIVKVIYEKIEKLIRRFYKKFVKYNILTFKYKNKLQYFRINIKINYNVLEYLLNLYKI